MSNLLNYSTISKFTQERFMTPWGEAVNIINSDGYPAIWDTATDPIINARFSVFHKPITNVTRRKTYTLGGIYLAIREPYFATETSQLRSIDRKTHKADYDNFKKRNFNYACFSGVFDRRAENGIIQHSGLICIDLDKLPDVVKAKNTLSKDEHVLMCFTSPGGEGLKVIFQVEPTHDPKGHEKQYYRIKSYLKIRYGLTADDGAKDISRATLLCHDPDIYLNPLILERGFSCK